MIIRRFQLLGLVPLAVILCACSDQASKSSAASDLNQATSSTASTSTSPDLELPEKITFNKHIRPIFNKNCTSCHGGVFAGNDAKMPGGLSLIYPHLAMGKGASGKKSIVPGNPEESELYKRITTNDEDDLMPQPKHGPRLHDREVALIKKWIKQGAEWQVHWAFEPPKDLPLPKLDSPNSKHPIDLFVQEKLEEMMLTPSPEATPSTLLRRLSFDLTGLPPSIKNLDTFLKAYEENSEKAYQNAVKQLLANAAYGERWASVWLDLARYADSEGLGMDARRTMWPYRDWVIQAYNNDLPYDQFTIKQLAGDQLNKPVLADYVATGFHRNTQVNREGGTDDEEFRVAAVLDRVNTTWEVLQGQTFGCVQCHSHPYDTFEMKEYYKFAAFFNNDRDADDNRHTPTMKIPTKEKDFAAALAAHKDVDSTAKTYYGYARSLISNSTWEGAKNATVNSKNTKTKIVKTPTGEEIHSVGNQKTRSQYSQTWKPSTSKLSGIKVQIIPTDIEKARSSPEPGSSLSYIRLQLNRQGKKPEPVTLTHCIPDSREASLNARLSLSGKNSAGWGPYTKHFHPRWAVFFPDKEIDLTGVDSITVIMDYNNVYDIGFISVPQRLKLETTNSSHFHQNIAKLAQQRTQFVQAEQKLKKIKGVSMPVMLTRDHKLARDTHVFKRGNWLEKGEFIKAPDTPASFPPIGTATPTRLDMAKWIVSKENPLSARVEVNRIWQQLFGTGIVETLEDFGSSGMAPTNQKLLDHLAYKFQQDFNYSRKKLIHYIVTSATYKQTPIASQNKRAKDPTNTYLSYGTRRRLRAESVRDMGLASSNLLTTQLYGPPTFPPIPPGVWKPFVRDRWLTPKVGEAQRYRRSIYIYMKRSIPYPALAAFDVPTREICSKRRLISNTPTAALITLNDEAFAEFAQGLARRMKNDAEGSLEDKISHGYRIVTSHQPNKKILQSLVAAYKAAEDSYKKSPTQLKGIASTPDGGAFTILASLILNLDASLTK